MPCQEERIFRTQFSCQWLFNRIKVLWLRFQQCLCPFTMLNVEGSSEMGVFRHLSNHDFRIPNFGIKKAVTVIFHSKCLKINIDFKKAAKKSEKVFCFWDHCIWIGIVKLSQCRTRYFSSAANLLRSSPKIWHANKRDLFQLNFLGSDWWIW